jgi:hypothetical protein
MINESTASRYARDISPFRSPIAAKSGRYCYYSCNFAPSLSTIEINAIASLQ